MCREHGVGLACRADYLTRASVGLESRPLKATDRIRRVLNAAWLS